MESRFALLRRIPHHEFQMDYLPLPAIFLDWADLNRKTIRRDPILRIRVGYKFLFHRFSYQSVRRARTGQPTTGTPKRLRLKDHHQ